MVLYGILRMLVGSAGASLQRKFVSLGNMTGKTKDEIIAVVGSPSSISAMSNGEQLLQWQETGYHIAIRFDAEGQFRGITHQFARR